MPRSKRSERFDFLVFCFGVFASWSGESVFWQQDNSRSNRKRAIDVLFFCFEKMKKIKNKNCGHCTVKVALNALYLWILKAWSDWSCESWWGSSSSFVMFHHFHVQFVIFCLIGKLWMHLHAFDWLDLMTVVGCLFFYKQLAPYRWPLPFSPMLLLNQASSKVLYLVLTIPSK